MTTQLISTKRHDSRHDASESTMPIGPQPGSPTLTNPDMILPDYNELMGYNDLPVPQRPLWNSSHSIQDGFQFVDNNFYANPNPLTTPILYGNGTMLSDIGEVTEVESNAGGPNTRGPSRRTTLGSTEDVARLPQAHPRSTKPKFFTAGRRFSTDSTSTIGAGERAAFFDFDDTISNGGDSICQGDDEESLASSYAEDLVGAQSIQVARRMSLRRINDEASANSMSKRAEEILANAKQRLTDMEDNLSRARTLSYSLKRDGSTPGPVGRSASTTYRGSSVPPGASIHRKNMSEDALTNPKVGSAGVQRSASALGSAGGYRRALPASKSAEPLSPEPNRGAYALTHRHPDMPLEPLGEDDYTDTISGRLGGVGSPASAIFESDSPRSSSTVRDLQDQMNGLKGKISSLREQARVDSLKRRSLQSLRTPSPLIYADWSSVLTDARKQHSSDNDPVVAELKNGLGDDGDGNVTPRQERFSGFDAVPEEEMDEAVTPVQKVRASHRQSLQRIPPPRRNILNGPGPDAAVQVVPAAERATQESQKKAADGQRKEQQRKPEAVNNSGALRNGKPAINHGSDEAMDNQGYESESGESLYHEAIQHQISHEDRADAFDYEHFFLHSAMSNMRARSGSVDSVESTDSVETARGPTEPGPRRRPSVDTMASADSFETATEGMGGSSRSSSAQGYRVYMPTNIHKNGRPVSILSFQGSSSGSDSTAVPSQDGRRRPSSMQLRPASVSVSAKPSYSSIESTGTTRSFPLVNKARRTSSSISSHNGVLTPPGSSPDHGARTTPKPGLKEAPTIHVQEKTDDRGMRGASPAVQMLAPADQRTVEALVAGMGKCILVLGEPSGGVNGAHDVYRRRLEMARQILEGTLELP
ncbi:hypothetical protein ESCO_000958 [Escovopsis weberi]|uniref:Uncharacterized protein n=1 Tax=Escovopsis weberi TaxID=150374 RepID=A0A0M8N3T9_ESCWE|nr:hypothetical protein ESCO_000958 [Escovopsis weberi]